MEAYRTKRDFKKTAEPRRAVKQNKRAVHHFVIQKHAASHLHYDFRLEMDGVLRSWALPKGLSTKKGERRLAMHVEDHPLDYADFEGIIPPGKAPPLTAGAGTENTLPGASAFVQTSFVVVLAVACELRFRGKWRLPRLISSFQGCAKSRDSPSTARSSAPKDPVRG